MMTEFDCIVIGGGIIGASIFYHLAYEGYKVCLLEKNHIASGCTSQSLGMVRCFHDATDLSDRAIESWEYYQTFQANIGEPCDFNFCPFVYFPTRDKFAWCKQEVHRLSKKINIESFTKDAFEKHFQLNLEAFPGMAVVESKALYLNPTQASLGWIKGGIKCGGIVYEETFVKNIVKESDTITLETSGGIFIAKKIVLSAGIETPLFFQKSNDFPPFYSQEIYLEAINPSPNKFIPFAFYDENKNVYGRPDFSTKAMYLGTATRGLKPTQYSNHISKTVGEIFNTRSKNKILSTFSSLDCYTEDKRGFVGSFKSNPAIYIAAGFSGLGVTMAPWVGNEMVRIIKNETKS